MSQQRCQRCSERPASVQVTEHHDGQTTKLLLCEECARELGQKLSFSFQNLLAAFAKFDEENGDGGGAGGAELTCGCGHTFAQFRETGRLGCARCYTTFREALEGLLRKVHGSARHAGRAPARRAAGLTRSRALRDLEQQLQDAIRREAYEEAARLRDRIRALQRAALADGDEGAGA